MTINDKNLCPSCFTELQESQSACPVCGYVNTAESPYPTALPIGTVLLGQYIIGRTLGKGGFGVTYLAYDSKEDKKVAVKEYLPDSLIHRDRGDTLVSTVAEDKDGAFKKGADRFFEEAQMVSRFNGNPGLIWVYKFFYENNTAYFVMEYLEGGDLKSYIAEIGGTLDEKQVLDIVAPLIDSLIIVHSIGILHRDISPDNIYMTGDGKIKLIDFGAARQVVGEVSKSLSVILKQGFAPIEQYQTKGKQGPWTDIYALGATMYYCLTGQIPEAPMDRMESDSLAMPANISPQLQGILRKMMAIRATDRYQDMMELKKDMQANGLLPGMATSQNTDVAATPIPSTSYGAAPAEPYAQYTQAPNSFTQTPPQYPQSQGQAYQPYQYPQQAPQKENKFVAFIKNNRMLSTLIAVGFAAIMIVVALLIVNNIGNNEDNTTGGGIASSAPTATFAPTPAMAQEKTFTKAGLTITLNSNFTDNTGMEGGEHLTIVYLSERDNAGVLVTKEEFSLFDANGVSSNISLGEYAQMVMDGNGVVGSSVEHSDDLTHFIYDNNEFRYYSVVYRGSDAYWVVQFYTSVSDFERLLPTFVQWAKTVDVGQGNVNDMSSIPVVGSTTWVSSAVQEGYELYYELAFTNDNKFYYVLSAPELDYYSVMEGTYTMSADNSEIFLNTDHFTQVEGSEHTVTTVSETDIFTYNGDTIVANEQGGGMTFVQGMRSGLWFFGKDLSTDTSEWKGSELDGNWTYFSGDFINYFEEANEIAFTIMGDGEGRVHDSYGEWGNWDVDTDGLYSEGSGILKVTGEESGSYEFTYRILYGVLSLTDSDGDSRLYIPTPDVTDQKYTYTDPYMQGASGTYTGQWEDGKPHGWGMFVFDKTYSDMGFPEMYHGYWENGNKHGLGFASWSDGTEYAGNFVNNKKQGFGIMWNPDGSEYHNGQWNNDNPA